MAQQRTDYPTPLFDPAAQTADSLSEPVEDSGAYGPAARPEYIGDPTRPDVRHLTLIGVLVDILAVLNGTYNDKGRPEQINISPGTAGPTSSLTTHVRYHISRIKGSSGAGGHIIDISVGTEIVETIYNFLGGPFDYAASFWIDRGAQVSAVERAAAVNFTCILIGAEAD